MVTKVLPVPRTTKIKTSRTKGIKVSRVIARHKVPTAMAVENNSNLNSPKPVLAIATVPKKNNSSRFNPVN